MAVFKNQLPPIPKNLTICSAKFSLANSSTPLDRIKTNRNLNPEQL